MGVSNTQNIKKKKKKILNKRLGCSSSPLGQNIAFMTIQYDDIYPFFTLSK